MSSIDTLSVNAPSGPVHADPNTRTYLGDGSVLVNAAGVQVQPVGNDGARAWPPTLNTIPISIFRQSVLQQQSSRRDVDKECGYDTDITATQYQAIFDREGLGTRVVELLPEECWAEDPLVQETEEADETPFEAAVAGVIREHNLWHYLQRLDTLSRIGRYGVMLLGIDDGLPLDQPVAGVPLDGKYKQPQAAPGWVPTKGAQQGGQAAKRPTGKATGGDTGKPARRLVYLRVFPESLVQVAEWERDETSPRFGHPVFYNIQMADLDDGQQGGHTTQKKVHWTRVIHAADNRTSSEVLGTPAMKRVWNRITDIRKVLGGSGEMYWKGGFPGIMFEALPDVTSIDSAALREANWRYEQGLQRYMELIGLKANQLDVQVADPTGHLNAQLDYICIALGCPKRIFLGSERGELASTQDQRAWNRRVGRRREKYVSPMLIRPTIDRLIAMGVLPPPTEDETGDYLVEWDDLNAPSDQDKATVAKALVEAIARYIEAGADELVPPMHFLTKVLDFTQEEAEAIIADAEKQAEENLDKELEKRARLIDEGVVPDPQAAPAPGGPPQPGGKPAVPKPPKPGGDQK